MVIPPCPISVLFGGVHERIRFYNENDKHFTKKTMGLMPVSVLAKKEKNYGQ